MLRSSGIVVGPDQDLWIVVQEVTLGAIVDVVETTLFVRQSQRLVLLAPEYLLERLVLEMPEDRL